jgi:hypothetical protein
LGTWRNAHSTLVGKYKKEKKKKKKKTDVAGKAVLQLLLKKVDRIPVAQDRVQWQILM